MESLERVNCMKITLIPTKKLIMTNGLKEVSNNILFEKGSVPTTDGLLSTDIFGVSTTERRDTFAYINLNGPYLQPFVYKMLKRMNRNFESIVHGSKKFRIDEKGILVADEEKGQTGLEFLYKNWNNINFEKNNSMIRNERIDVLNAFDRDTLFTKYCIVIPAFYRDVNLQSASQGRISHHEINDLYALLIRLAYVFQKDNNFDFVLDNTRAKIQDTMVDIYDLLKGKLEKKNGLIRKSLLGKSIDYGSRSVISAPIFNANKPEEMQIDFYHCGVPLAQCCSLFTPFIVSWVKRFFQREVEKMGSKFPVKRKNGEIVYVKLKDPELHFTEDYIKKQIDRFVFSNADRFEPIPLPVEDKEFEGKVFLTFAGRFYNGSPESESPLMQRQATWCDVLYQAVSDVTSDKMVWVTRYPLLDYFGMFPNKVAVLSTQETEPMYIGGKLYTNYPKIDLDMPKDKVSVNFVDTVTMSNLYLAGLGGDYDGDQVTLKGVYSQEACAEAEKIMRSKAHILNIYGQNMRKTTNEGVQTLYMLTKFKETS
jgi:DNA-directed RNA polymerase beta' subunit